MREPFDMILGGYRLSLSAVLSVVKLPMVVNRSSGIIPWEHPFLANSDGIHDSISVKVDCF